MLLKKEGFPEEDELVLCTVTKVQFHSVFVNLDEYQRSGMIHISEVSPGRIRNIRDFVKEGKKVVCKVLRVNMDRGHIDLSLRRVSENQKRKKIDEIKQEQKSEKILELIAKESKIDVKKFFDDVISKVLKKHQSLYEFFQKVASDNNAINDAELDSKVAKKLEEEVKSRIKEVSVKIEGKFKLTSFEPNGVDIIKESLIKAEESGKENISIKYSGAGTYNVKIIAKNYKQAEIILKEVSIKALGHMEKFKSQGEFIRQES
jgi:translation initiation factor 2 subunit 1